MENQQSNETTADEIPAVPPPAICSGWMPIETAPRDGTYILLAGPSGYVTTHLRVEVCRYDPEYRPLQPWVNHANDSFTDGGSGPTHWMPMPDLPNAKAWQEGRQGSTDNKGDKNEI